MWFISVVLLINPVWCDVVVPWWNSAVYYNVLVDSFKDADGDGLGDLKGVTKQISYVRAVGADAVILSPISARSTDCSTPGIISHTDIDPRFGNLDAFNDLLKKTKKIELKLVITLPLNTVSSSSEWFSKSSSKEPGFEDWFLWKDGSSNQPPTPEGDLEWKWSEPRGAFYGSSKNETILNLCSEGVTSALSAAQCSWLRRGVSGVLLNPDFKEQSCGEKLLRKLFTEAMGCVRAGNLETPVFLVQSSLEPNIAAKYYDMGANSVLSGTLTSANRSTASELALAFYSCLLIAPEDVLPTWITSKSLTGHTATRLGSDMVDAINLFALILPGAAVIQQGDELGAVDTILEWASSSDTCWPNEKNPAAAPFPWDDTVNGGFSANDPWLPLAPNYRYANAKTEFKNEFSHLGVLRVAAALRKHPAMGPHADIKRLGNALAILRWGDAGSLLLISNVGSEQTEAQLTKIPGLPAEMTVAASSAVSSMSVESHVVLEKTLKLAPGETVLLAGGHRHCGGPGPVDKIATKLSEGWQKLNKYFGNI